MEEIISIVEPHWDEPESPSPSVLYRPLFLFHPPSSRLLRTWQDGQLVGYDGFASEWVYRKSFAPLVGIVRTRTWSERLSFLWGCFFRFFLLYVWPRQTIRKSWSSWNNKGFSFWDNMESCENVQSETLRAKFDLGSFLRWKAKLKYI